MNPSNCKDLQFSEKLSTPCLSNRNNPILYSNGYWHWMNQMNQLAYVNGSNPQVNLPPNFNINCNYGQSNVPASTNENSLNLDSSGNLLFNEHSTFNGVKTPLSYLIVNDDINLPSPSSIVTNNENNGSSLSEIENMRIQFPNVPSFPISDSVTNTLKTNSLISLSFNEDQNMFSSKIDKDGMKEISSSSSNVNKKEMEFSTKGSMTDERKSPSLTDTANNVQGNKRKNTKSTNEAYIHAMIAIKLWNMSGKVMNKNYRLIDKSPDPHRICYYIPRTTPKDANGNSEINVSIDYGSILKILPEIKYMKICYEKEEIKDEEYDLEKEGNKSYQITVLMKTFKPNKPIYLSFRDEKNERLRIFIKLEDSSTTRIRFKNKDKKSKDENSMDKSEKKSESVENCMKFEIIDGFIKEIRKVPEKLLNISIRFGLKEMSQTFSTAIQNKIFEEEDINIVKDAVEEFLENPKKETHEKLSNIIFNLVKDEKKKNELSILCFDCLYKFICNIDDSVDIFKVNYFNNEIYKKFLKNYTIGQYRENHIVFTMDDFAGDALETKTHSINCESENCKRGYNSISENEDHHCRKQQKVDKDGNIFRLTDK